MIETEITLTLSFKLNKVKPLLNRYFFSSKYGNCKHLWYSLYRHYFTVSMVSVKERFVYLLDIRIDFTVYGTKYKFNHSVNNFYFTLI